MYHMVASGVSSSVLLVIPFCYYYYPGCAGWLVCCCVCCVFRVLGCDAVWPSVPYCRSTFHGLHFCSYPQLVTVVIVSCFLRVYASCC